MPAFRVSALELPARYGDPDAALAEVEALASCSPTPDLVLLPETSLTGYVSPSLDFDLSRFAEPFDGSTVVRVSELARRMGSAIASPLIERDGDRYFNAFFVVDRSGEVIARYRKRHPWYPETWATPGDAPYAQLTLGGVRFLVAICFDIHFLEDEAKAELERADVLLFPSAWVDDGAIDLRDALLGRLAERYDLMIVNANWGPGVPRVRGQGGTRVVTKTSTRRVGEGERRIDLMVRG